MKRRNGYFLEGGRNVCFFNTVQKNANLYEHSQINK